MTLFAHIKTESSTGHDQRLPGLCICLQTEKKKKTLQDLVILTIFVNEQ